MTDLQRALAQISDIRQQVAETKLFRGFGPLVITMTGLLALLLAVLQGMSDPALRGLDLLLPWIVLACLSAVLIGGEMWALSNRAHGAAAHQVLWAMIEKFIPPLLAGAVIGGVVLMNAPTVSWILPGLWQILIALALFAARPMLPSNMLAVAGWYFLTGLAVLLWASQQGYLTPWLMGVPFGVGQLLMAGVLQLSAQKGLL